MFLQNLAENQQYEKGYAENLSRGASVFDGDAYQVSNESEAQFTPNLTVFDLMSVDTGDADFSPFSSGFDLDFKTACAHSALPRDVSFDGHLWSTADPYASFLPSTIFTSAAVPADVVLSQLNRPISVRQTETSLSKPAGGMCQSA